MLLLPRVLSAAKRAPALASASGVILRPNGGQAAIMLLLKRLREIPRYWGMQ